MSGFNLSRLVARGWLMAAIIAGTAAFAASPSHAQNIATTTASVNQRTGPGTGYAVVQVLPAGAQVSVSQCTAATGWCELVYRSRNGWVSARYLNFSAAVSGDAPPVVTPPQGSQVQAQTTVQLNMRRGPDTSYAVIRAVPAGAIVPVFRCTNSYLWCEIAYANSTGWVSAQYLRSTSAQYQQQPLPNVAAQLGLQLFNFIIGQVTGQQPIPPQPPQPRVPGPGEVCFYADFDYGGAVTCTVMGQNQPGLGGDWNDRISGIRVGQNAWVEVCTDYNYAGTCRIVTQNTARLPVATNDRISSYRTTQGGGTIPGPGPTARACFYSDYNDAGPGFCLNVNQDIATLPADWNDRISSIRLDPGVTVQVCQNNNYGGWCEQYTGDVPALFDTRNDAISSIRVR